MNKVKHCCNNINDSDDQIDPIFNSKECYACTQVGVPVFHSTRCDPTHQPQLRWERTAGSSMTLLRIPTDLKCRPQDLTRPRAIDPRSSSVKRWNRIVLMARGLSIAVDPLFFYVMALSQIGAPCFYMTWRLPWSSPSFARAWTRCTWPTSCFSSSWLTRRGSRW